MGQNHEQDERRQWHLDKGVSVTHLFSTISAIVIVAIFLSQQDTRITVLEKANVTVSKDATDQKQMVREDLRRIEDKIDHLLQHGDK